MLWKCSENARGRRVELEEKKNKKSRDTFRPGAAKQLPVENATLKSEITSQKRGDGGGKGGRSAIRGAGSLTSSPTTCCRFETCYQISFFFSLSFSILYHHFLPFSFHFSFYFKHIFCCCFCCCCLFHRHRRCCCCCCYCCNYCSPLKKMEKGRKEEEEKNDNNTERESAREREKNWIKERRRRRIFF